MTQGTHTPQDPVDRLANIVERFIDISSRRMDQMEQATLRTQERQDQAENRQGQLERAQIRFQEQLGELAGYVRRAMADMEEYRRRQDEHDRKWEELRQRQVESDQRFNVMLQEIRFLIRQQRSAEDDPTQGEGGA